MNFLIFLRGKIEGLSFDLLIEGEDTTELDSAQGRLDRVIRDLRRSLMENWRRSAATTLADLRRANRNIQDNIRELKEDMSKLQKVVNIIGKVDDVVGLARGLLPV